MIAIDSSVIVPALAKWHEQHKRAAEALDRALGSPEGVIVAAHALFETYSVLTRLPERYRASGRDVMNALRNTFAGCAIVSFPSDEAWTLLEDLVATDVTGGTTYDALILRTVESAGATSILTLNRRDFHRLNSHIRIEVP